MPRTLDRWENHDPKRLNDLVLHMCLAHFHKLLSYLNKNRTLRLVSPPPFYRRNGSSDKVRNCWLFSYLEAEPVLETIPSNSQINALFQFTILLLILFSRSRAHLWPLQTSQRRECVCQWPGHKSFHLSISALMVTETSKAMAPCLCSCCSASLMPVWQTLVDGLPSLGFPSAFLMDPDLCPAF